MSAIKPSFVKETKRKQEELEKLLSEVKRSCIVKFLCDNTVYNMSRLEFTLEDIEDLIDIVNGSINILEEDVYDDHEKTH